MPFLILLALLGGASYGVISSSPQGSDDDLLAEQLEHSSATVDKHLVGNVVTHNPTNNNLWH